MPASRPSRGGVGDQQTMVGALLIGLAVILGLVLLVKGFGDDGSTTNQASSPVTTIAAEDLNAPPSVDPSDTSMSTAVLRPPAEVTVLVANAAGIGGAASKVASTLTAEGYTIIDTMNAPSTSPDIVFYSGDMQGEAEALAASLGLDASVVKLMPDPPPVTTKDADLLVMVGANLASEDLPASGSGSGSSSTTAP